MCNPIYTREEILKKIKDIDSIIVKVTHADSYSLNSGMTSQSVKYQSLDALRKEREYWLNQLAEWDVQCGCKSILTPMRML